MIASTSWAIMSRMSEICFEACELALVYTSSLMLRFFASLLMDSARDAERVDLLLRLREPDDGVLELRFGGLTLHTFPLACAMSCWAFLPPLPPP